MYQMQTLENWVKSSNSSAERVENVESQNEPTTIHTESHRAKIARTAGSLNDIQPNFLAKVFKMTRRNCG